MLVTGPTGSGKSTTLAAIIDQINTTYRKHIVTIEDPVEFVHHEQAVGLLAARGRRTTPRASPPRCAPPSARTPT